MSKRFLKFLPIFALAIYFIVLFNKTLLQQVWPFPGDVLVTFFYPWNNGGWEGFVQGIFHKQAIASDVFRLYIPWKSLGTELVRIGQLPLWNPYSFAGTPLLANLQSSFFYPFGLFFYILPILPAWLIYLFLQPVIGFFGMYLYLRTITKSRASAIFGSIGFISTGFMLTWFDWGIVGHAASWMGWLLFAYHKVFWQNKTKFKFLIPVFIALAILAGYPQITVLIFISLAFYCLVPILNAKTNKAKSLLTLFLFSILGILITSIQLLPTLELSQLSARGVGSGEIFSTFRLPFQNLVTVLSPDFFGNIAVNNFWGSQNYQESLLYFGITLLPFSLLAISAFRKNLTVKFFSLLALISLVLALPLPFSNTLKFIPVVSSGIPMRILFLFQSSMVILAAIGLDHLLSGSIKRRKILATIFVLTLSYCLIWTATFILKNNVDPSSIAVAQRNLILPSFIAALSSILLILLFIRSPKRYILCSVLVVLVIFEASYFFNKFSPFAPTNYFFPAHPLFNDLSRLGKIERTWGYKTGSISPNFSTYYRFQTINGYESLYLNRYGQLLSSIEKGELTPNLQRADANFPENYSANLIKIARLMGVSFYSFRFDQIEKENDPMWSRHISKAKTIRNDFWPISQDLKANPRAFLVNQVVVANGDKDLIEKMFSKTVDLRNTIVLEENPNLPLGQNSGKTYIKNYSPNKVEIETESFGNFLFLSDNYYPGWNAYVDGKKSKIYRANYTFRAVYIPAGKHLVSFKYESRSLQIGAIVTFVSISIFLGLFFQYRFSKKKS